MIYLVEAEHLRSDILDFRAVHSGEGGISRLVSMLGELVQTNGHHLGPNQVLVGHVACLGHGGGGHTSWHCRTCDAVNYGPPRNTYCTALEGPAVVRISTSRDR